MLLVLFVSSNLAILYLSNIGYVLATSSRSAASCCCARTGPTGRGRSSSRPLWLLVAGVLLVLNIVFLLVGALAPKLNGYGTWTDFAIGVGVLFGSLLLFIFRRVVQDGESVHFREETPTMPEEVGTPVSVAS